MVRAAGDKFFDMLQKQSENVVLGANEFERFVKNYSKLSPSKREAMVKSVKEIEHDGDMIIHGIVDMLNKTFITPIDREDIYRLTTLLDDVLDFINAAAIRIQIFRIRKMDRVIVEMADVIKEIVGVVNILIKNMTKNHNDMKKYSIRINKLENDADTIYRKGLAELFKNGRNAIKIIKTKEIYEILETVTDKAEDVGNVVESIVVKYA